MITEPCDLRPPASTLAGWPAAGQGTIHAVMLITGSSASSGSRMRGSRFLTGRARYVRHLPGLSPSFAWCLAGTGRTKKIRILRCSRDIHGGNCRGPEQHLACAPPAPRTGRTALRDRLFRSPGDARWRRSTQDDGAQPARPGFPDLRCRGTRAAPASAHPAASGSPASRSGKDGARPVTAPGTCWRARLSRVAIRRPGPAGRRVPAFCRGAVRGHHGRYPVAGEKDQWRRR